ncbi:hypothetical protein H6P81_008512 [Aristolochia fimbriata]|uniref:Auxin transport protein BIG n=1 Tax=Aristolochia fimbriata TaxID=158543 RepID=A0AAV7ELH8_ARIFI|nr:hypothetical protein H6P81_008512 [Aristolochia fimbriata]
MADQIAKVLELFLTEKSPKDLAQKLNSDTAKTFLESFYRILEQAVEPIGDGKLGFQTWDNSQVQSVASVGRLIVSATRSLSVELVEPIFIGVAEKCLEFATCYLEKSVSDGVDMSSQNGIVQLLEKALIDELVEEFDVPHLCTLNSLAEALPVLQHRVEGVNLDKHIKCNIQGINCSKETRPVDRVLITLSSENFPSDSQDTQFTELAFRQESSSMLSLGRHLAVVHVRCVHRLIVICRDMVQMPEVFEERKEDANFRSRLSFSLRILKLLGNLTKNSPYVAYDAELLDTVSSFADIFPNLFKTRFDFLNHDAALSQETGLDSLLLFLLEEFLQFVHVVFCDGTIFHNIQTCIIASLLDILDVNVWRYDKSEDVLKAPLVYSPRVVMYLLKLVGNVKNWTSQIHIWEEKLDVDPSGSYSFGDGTSAPSCYVRSEKVSLLKKYTCAEHLKLMLPQSSQWVDSMMHLAHFLHSEGVKSKQKVDRLRSGSIRTGGTSDTESAVSHEDEALFGDLFSEAGRSVVPSDGPDQASVSACSISACCNVLIQAATELLNFLKVYIFSPEWNSTVYEDACSKLKDYHVDFLISVLLCQVCYADERVVESDTPLPANRKVAHINEVCFELLHGLIVRRALSDSLEEHFVDEILKVDCAAFAYNDHTLTLLANILICKVGPAGTRLRTRIVDGYVQFIVDKAKNVCTKCPNLIREFLPTLPCVLHLEILLMAFHLSSENEKAALAAFVLSSLKAMDVPTDGCNILQLSCWSLLVSRLVLVLRHMISYSSTCPSWLLLRLRSKLRESPARLSISHAITDSVPSWVSIMVRTITGEAVRELTGVACVLPQLIDVAIVPGSVYRDDQAFIRLGLSWIDLCDTFASILGLWKGKKADTVEDLILERYIFSICWDTLGIGTVSRDHLPLELNLQDLDINNMKSFYHFGHALLNDKHNLSEVVVRVLNQLHAVDITSKSGEQGWDLLKCGAWFSLVISLLHAGIWGFSVNNAAPGVEQLWTEQISKDVEFRTLGCTVVASFLENNLFAWLLKVLSSLLIKHLQILEEAFVATLDQNRCYVGRFSPLLLLKHAVFKKCAKNELLDKCGSCVSVLESIFSLLPKLDEVINKEGSGSTARVFLSSLLHGFPCHSSTSSAALVSTILSVRGIICTLDGLLKVKNAGGGDILLDREARHGLLESVIAVKSDMIFQHVHKNCEAIYSNLTSFQNERQDHSYLFVMKQMESFLTEVSSNEVVDVDTHDVIILCAVDFIEDLRKDPLKSEIFKYYVGAGEVYEKDKELYDGKRGDLLVLFDVLSGCYSEPVNVKVLNFFVELLAGEICPGLRDSIQKKFLAMDLPCLSDWLERRLLGGVKDASGALTSTKGISVSLRESTVNFISCLVSTADTQSKAVQCRFIEALLTLLDGAFMIYDIHIAKAYFNFLVQLSNGEPSMKQLLKMIFTLIEKLAGHENKLQELKFLFGFLGTVLSACGAKKNVMDKFSGKYLSSNSSGPETSLSRSVGSRKTSETQIIPSNQETGSASLDCDATSVDEDEDDGTSDGELASVDRDDDEDSSSERALASKVCTFTSSGSNFMEQHWYFCYTCDLTVSKGCCSICAKVCHRGHRVVYSRSSRFFCDCGAGGVRGSSCQCLKPRKFTGNSGSIPSRGPSNFPSLLPLAEDGDQTPDSDSEPEDDAYIDVENPFKLSIPREVQEALPLLLQEVDVEGRVLELCNKLLPVVISRRDASLLKDKKVVLGEDKVLSYNVDLLQLKKSYKSGSLDLKIKADYSNSRELKSHLNSGSLIKSLLSISKRGRLASGEGDKVTVFDAGQLIGQPTVAPVTADKTNVKPLSKNVVRFEVVHVMFNPVVESYLAVAGFEECQVLTVNPRGEVTDRLPIELALQGAYIRKVDWVPGSQVQLMVVTNLFVKIYDLSQDNISPIHYFTLEDDFIVDAALVVAPKGKLFLLVLSELGCLYRLELAMGGEIGARTLKEIIRVQGKDKLAKGLSIYFSLSYKMLFLSYQDGTTLIGRLNANATSLMEISAVYEDEHEGKLKNAGLHHWKELIAGSGVFLCYSSLKSNSAFAVSLGPHELLAHNIRSSGSSTLPLVGITSYRPLSKDKTQCLVLHDDGSLQIFSHVPLGADNAANPPSDQSKKLGSGILKNRAYASSTPEFPLDFFEKTVCITADVKFSGDAIRNSDSDGAKQSLAADDGFLESPSPGGFKITVSNSNPDIVMVGIRVQVGNTSLSHIPSEITIFQRVIKLDEGMRSWYDIPFTVAESLLADEEFTISVGPTFNGSHLPRIDSLEIYGRAKDEFGWKEKMDAVLDMEAHALGSSSGIAGAGKKGRLLQTAPVQEQVVADGLKLLSRYYSLCGSQGCADTEKVKVELSTLKCRKLLETIFESDREPLLLSAACHVLQAVFPRREIYYQMKDTMRLLGVVSSSPLLISRLGVGGAVASWVIQEFTAQVRAVSKIALHRRTNMASFLETHGTRVIDGLMQVLWGILDLEQPDTQTINNIVIPSVELIYSYAESLALHGNDGAGRSVKPAVVLLRKLLFAPYEAVQTSSSLAISSRLLQVPFPKQTMLTSDDSVETTSAAPLNSAIHGATGGNTQVMIEEDSTTSSVQYCCDGCSTVPILRRRWHCNVCPDFDLCEACYEVMDADRLPPPHSRDHPMSAIPIEVDSIGGDGNEIHFSMDDLNEPSILQVASDISIQNSPPPVHLLEHNDASGEFPPVVDQRIVSISASKRIVNSLILRELVTELRGWMETTSGHRAIPVMQLFYRLSSAVGGPFMDTSKPENMDLEKFIKWFMDEINLSKPFVPRTRSSFGEVLILVFMFFTLMLRNWHQPGSDSSLQKSTDNSEKGVVQIPSSTSSASPSIDDQEKEEFVCQLLRACSLLRQQNFVNYLMDILQQLVHVLKSLPTNLDASLGTTSSSGCGALLTIRKELPAGNFSPFFSDSYAKSHRSDFFVDYHRLLLENTFRLVYSLVRPEKQDKSVEKDRHDKSVYRTLPGKDLKLEGYQDVLCSYINNPHTTFVRRYARRLFLHLCGSKTHYYNVRDSWQLSNEVKKLYKLVDKTGGFQNPVPYERSVKLVKCLSAISEVAGARPRNWQKYCLRHGDVLSFLMNGVFTFGEESVLQTLKLLNLAFYTGKDMGPSTQKAEAGDGGSSSNKAGAQFDTKKKKKSDDGNENGSEKTYMDMEPAVHVFNGKDASTLRRFIDLFLLEWNSAAVRLETKCVLYGVWHHGKQPFKETMLKVLLEKVKSLPMYGQNIVEYTELLIWLLGKVPEGALKQQDTDLVTRCLSAEVIKSIFDILHSQNELLANHPNSRIYNTLSGLVEFDGYYLESEPCVACSCPEVPYTKMKLESLKSETKFTDNRIIVKCTGSYTIQTVTMNVHDARKSKSVKVLNLYYNNRPVSDLSELKNNWSLWKRAKSCHLAFNQTELKVEFPIPTTACNFMIELDSFYENLQASSLESLQCPRCSRSVTDKHGICGNCHENAYQCRQCRNINYENLDSFLCNECGYSKYGRFEFNFMAKPSFIFDNMENDEDMKKGLAAIESESENAHRRYQQLLGFKKPLLKLVSSIGENEIDSQHKDSVQQMMVSMSGPSCKINRKIALLGVLYGEKCKAAFDSVSKSVQTLQGLRRVLMSYLHQKHADSRVSTSFFVVPRSPTNCYGCATTFVTQCLELLQVLSKHPNCKKQLVSAGILSELFENNIHQGPKAARIQARAVLCAFSEGDATAVAELNTLIQKKVTYCLEHHRSIDIAVSTCEELLLLSETCSMGDEFWEARLRVAFQLLFSSIKLGAKHPAISEHVILPCLRIVSQACTLPKPEGVDKEQGTGKLPTVLQSKDDSTTNASASPSSLSNGNKSSSELSEKHWDNNREGQDVQLLSYSEWEKGASYIDFVRRQYKISQGVKATAHRSRRDPQRLDYLALKYALRWKRHASRRMNSSTFSRLELGSWVSELVLSACSQSIRSETCSLLSLLCGQSLSRRFQLLNLLIGLLPSTLSAGESAAEYFDLLFRMIELEDARLFLTAKGCLTTICKLISKEVSNIASQEKSLHVDISQGFILHKLIELLSKFLDVPRIRFRFMRDELLSEVLEALLVIRGLIVQKTKLISDCNRLLKDLLDGLLLESSENKRHFIRACISGLQNHGEERKGRTSLFILEQLCNIICPSKPEPVYLLILNKAHTQEEFIRGSMTKSPYSSAEIGPLMRDVKNKICHQLDLLGLLEDDYGMELLVAGNIISLDLSISQVYEQVWRKSHNQTTSTLVSSGGFSGASARDTPPMTVTYRLQGLDGEATEPMIKALEEEREESQDPEIEFAIAGAVRECGGLEIILGMIQHLRDDELKSNQEELGSVLNLLMYCCKIRENRQALLRLGALGLLLETARRAFSVDAMEPAEGILLIVESLTMEANESDIGITQSVLVTDDETGVGEQAKKIVLMFLERLCHPCGLKKSNKQQRNNEMVARILPYLTYAQPAAMEALILHFDPYLQDWGEYDRVQKQHLENTKDESLAEQAAKQRFALENFVRVSESLKTSSCGERLKDIILEKGITAVAVKHLRDSFACAGQAGFKTSAEWAFGLKLPSVPLILSMLRGLSRGHLATQKCIDDGEILSLLHALEGVSGENEIGARAENLLDTLSDEGKGDGFLGEKVHMLRHATKDEMRRRALMKREELLQGLGMRQEVASDGGERIVVSRPIIEGLEDVEEEEDGLACMVCREGYTLRPNDMLGVYSYSKRVNLGAGTSGTSRGDCVYTTVSHFNIIHFQCHQEAKRADAALKNPKKEWEGATLRNNETLCNCIFPLKGPSVPLAQYVRCVDQYWDNLNALGRADGSRLRLLTYDIVLMLARFATGASFSTDCKGGGKESNSRFLPFMIQMARQLLDQGGSNQRKAMAKSITTYLSSVSLSDPKQFGSSGTRASNGTEETVQFMMVNSLLSESYEEWLQHRHGFLQRGIYHAYMQHSHGRMTPLRLSDPTAVVRSEGSSSDSGESNPFKIVLPMLVYTGLIEQLQKFFKMKKTGNLPQGRNGGTCAESEGDEGNGGGLEEWEVTMKERLVNVKEMVGFSKEIISWLKDMTSASDLQEAFDVMGALADVLSGGFTRCEEFVQSAIGMGNANR